MNGARSRFTTFVTVILAQGVNSEAPHDSNLMYKCKERKDAHILHLATSAPNPFAIRPVTRPDTHRILSRYHLATVVSDFRSRPRGQPGPRPCRSPVGRTTRALPPRVRPQPFRSAPTHPPVSRPRATGAPSAGRGRAAGLRRGLRDRGRGRLRGRRWRGASRTEAVFVAGLFRSRLLKMGDERIAIPVRWTWCGNVTGCSAGGGGGEVR